MGQPFLIDIFVQTTFADWCNVLERYSCSICATFLRCLWVICAVCMARTEMMVPGWAVAVRQPVILPLSMYEIAALLLLTQVCAFVCDECFKIFVLEAERECSSKVCALPCMKSSQLAQICPHSDSTLRQIQSDKYRSTTQGFDEGRGGTDIDEF